MLVAKVRYWPESMKVDYFHNSLNAEIMAKALDQDNPPPLWAESSWQLKWRAASSK